MNKVVDLYVSRKDITTKMDVVQCSTEPDITFVLKDYTPEAGATARIFIKKPDSEVYNTCTISGNEVTFQPTTGSFDQAGPCVAQLEILRMEEVLVTYRIYVMVEPNTIDSGAIEASDDFTALQDALTAIDTWKTMTEENAADITAMQSTLTGVKNKTDKFNIQSGITRVTLGNAATTDTIRIHGDGYNKIAVWVANNADGKEYRLNVRENWISVSEGATDEMYRIAANVYKEGNYSYTQCFASGYAPGSSGQYHLWFNIPLEFAVNSTLSNVTITNATLRGTGGLVVTGADLTSNISSANISTDRKIRVNLQGLTNNFVANTPATLLCTLAFTVA